jgi:DNA-binding CsgD family transcriptional regulator
MPLTGLASFGHPAGTVHPGSAHSPRGGPNNPHGGAENGDCRKSQVEDLIRTILERKPDNSEGNADFTKDTSPEEIIFDLEIDGFRYLLIQLPKATQAPVQLSPREREIVRLVALGHSNKIIADVLNISSWTVCTHLRRIFAKLGVGSRAAMVAHLTNIGKTSVAGWNNRRGNPGFPVPSPITRVLRSAAQPAGCLPRVVRPDRGRDGTGPAAPPCLRV